MRATRGGRGGNITRPAGDIEHAQPRAYLCSVEQSRNGLSRNRREAAVISRGNLLPAFMFETPECGWIDRTHGNSVFSLRKTNTAARNMAELGNIVAGQSDLQRRLDLLPLEKN